MPKLYTAGDPAYDPVDYGPQSPDLGDELAIAKSTGEPYALGDPKHGHRLIGPGESLHAWRQRRQSQRPTDTVINERIAR